MDRFIVRVEQILKKQELYLKSNMDRFIGIVKSINLLYNVDLKSNMDRFIVKQQKTA